MGIHKIDTINDCNFYVIAPKFDGYIVTYKTLDFVAL